MDGDNHFVHLEGFPQSRQTEEDIKVYFRINGIQVEEIQQSPVLTTSNTPAWILTVTKQDALALTNKAWTLQTGPLIVRLCTEEDLQYRRESEEMISYRPDEASMMTMEGDAPGDEINDFQTFHESLGSNVFCNFTSMNPSVPSDSRDPRQIPTMAPTMSNMENVQQQGFQPLPYGNAAQACLFPPVAMGREGHWSTQCRQNYSPDNRTTGLPQAMCQTGPMYWNSPAMERPSPSEQPISPLEDEFKASSEELSQANTIEIHESNVKEKGEEMYRFFFENSRRGGGDIESFQVTDDNVIIIMFKDKEVAEKMITKGTATVGKHEVRIKGHKPLPVYKNKVLLQYQGAHKDKDSIELSLYIQARSKSENKPEFEAGATENVLMAKFTDNVDVPNLQKACSERPFRDEVIKVSEVQASCTLLVQDVPDNIPKDTIQDYFETCKAEVTRVEPTTKHDSYLVHLADYQDVRRMVRGSHQLGRHPLKVRSYHKAIDSQTTGQQNKLGPSSSDTCLLQFGPEYSRFLSKNHTIMAELEKRMKAENINISITQANKISISPIEHSQTDQSELTSLKQTAEKIVQEMVAQEGIRVPAEMSAASLLRGLHYNQNVVKCYTDGKIIKVVGSPAEVSEVSNKIKERTGKSKQPDEKPTKQNTISKQVPNLKPLVVQYLADVNYEEELTRKFPMIKLHIDTDKNEVTIEGSEIDTAQAQSLIHETVDSLITIELESLSEQQAALLNKPRVRNALLSGLKNKGIAAGVKSKQFSVEIISSSKPEAERASSFIHASVRERIVPLQPNMHNLLCSKVWKSWIQDMKDMFQDTFSITNVEDSSYLLIVGLKENIDALYDAASQFFDENSVEEEIVTISWGEYRFIITHLQKEVDKIAKDFEDDHGTLTYSETENNFRISGSRKGLDKAKDKLMTLRERVVNRKIILQKPGIAKLWNSESGCSIRTHVETKQQCVIETEQLTEEKSVKETTTSSVVLAVSNLPCGRKIHVRKGDITCFRVGAIVNAANYKLDHCGGLAKAIVDKGGRSIQEECNKYVAQHGDLLVGEAMVSKPGSLPCDIVIHAVGPDWQDGKHKESDYLREAVIKSLELADGKGCMSVAIPGLSTGIYGYPADQATRVITKTVDDFFRDKRNSLIKDIYFCDNNDNTLSEFVNAMKAVFDNVNVVETSTRRKTPLEQRRQHGLMARDVEYVKGEISQQQADIIVNTVNEGLDLSVGAVSQSLLKAAGSDLQRECSLNYPRGISPGTFATTNGYNLSCKKVFHACLPRLPKVEEEIVRKMVTEVVMRCLMKGDEDRSTSIVFPALGTGTLGYPPDMVAIYMLRTIEDFWTRKPNTSLTDVRIVLYDKDVKTIKAFEELKSDLNEGASQKRRPVLRRGDITRFEADVIVNPTDPRLTLDRGQLSKSISGAAGPQMKDECQRRYPHGVPISGLAVTSAGLLKAKEVYHVIIEPWNGNTGAEHLRKAVTLCLEEAHENGYQSILFPTLGVGLSKYPNDEAAQNIYKAIDKFWAAHPQTTLKSIQIVVFQENVAKVFAAKLKFFSGTHFHSRKGRKFKSSGELEENVFDVSGGVTFGNTQLLLVRGDLLSQDVDCIISSVHFEFDLTMGSINQAILQRFGDRIVSRDPQKKKDLDSKGLTVTCMSQAPFNMIIHFEEYKLKQDVKIILEKCIKKADKLSCYSVALPALGQGPKGGVPERHLIEYLYDTLISLKETLKNVHEVRLVIFEQDMYDRFMTYLQVLVSKQGFKQKTYFSRHHLDEKTQLMACASAYLPDASESGINLLFYSDNQANIDKAERELQEVFDKEFADKNIELSALKRISEARINLLYKEAKRQGVVIDLNTRLGRARVKGIKEDTENMIKKIYEMCIEHHDNEKTEAIASTVKWCYIDDKDGLSEYEQEVNKRLEKAYREDLPSYSLEDTDGKKYIVDFAKMVEYEEHDPSSECPVLRKDLLNAAEFDLPPNWDLSAPNNLQVIRIDSSSIEYNQVEGKFSSTNKQIVKIERIQNKTLYRQYQAKKQLFSQRTTNTKQVETELWHGTSTDAIPSINKDGFNRSFCGKNAVAYGNGVYFAMDPSYSTQDRYARRDAQGNQYIYLVDVLTGEYTQGKSGMRVPPPKDPKDPSVLFDSVVEWEINPQIFVIFNDTQAYPKYLITFK